MNPYQTVIGILIISWIILYLPDVFTKILRPLWEKLTDVHEELEIHSFISKRELKCSRCTDLGILFPTILEGDEAFRLTKGSISYYCCKDCLNRLQDEVK